MNELNESIEELTNLLVSFYENKYSYENMKDNKCDTLPSFSEFKENLKPDLKDFLSEDYKLKKHVLEITMKKLLDKEDILGVFRVIRLSQDLFPEYVLKEEFKDFFEYDKNPFEYKGPNPFEYKSIENSTDGSKTLNKITKNKDPH